jgi:hypothetical protein
VSNFIKQSGAAIMFAGILILTSGASIFGQDIAVSPAATNLASCGCIRDLISRASELQISQPDRAKLLKNLEGVRRRIALCKARAAGRRLIKFVWQMDKLATIGAVDQVTADSLKFCARTIALCRETCDGSVVNQRPVALAKSLLLSADADCQADVSPSQFDNGSFDPDGVVVARSANPPGPYPLGETIVTYTVVDNAGELSSTTASVLVEDTTGPSVINFSPNFLVLVSPGQSSGIAVFSSPQVTDSCSGIGSVSFSPPSGTVFPVGVNPTMLILVDGLGNTNQVPFNVVVIPNSGGGNGSNLAPVAIAKTVTNAADASCQALVTADQVDNHSFDPDGVIVSRIVQPSGPFPVNSVTPVTLTVVDDKGSSNSTVTTVTVLDLTPPTVSAPPLNITATPVVGQQFVVVNYPGAEITDNCTPAGISASYSPPSGTAFGVGTNDVTLTLSDWTGNSTNLTFRVIVKGFDATTCSTIAGLIERVEAVPLTGHFNSRRQTGLVTKLIKTQQNIELNRLRSADYRLGGFIRACSIYMDLDVLDHRIAAELIACATNIKNHLYDEK